MTLSPPSREVHGVFLYEAELDDLSQAYTVLGILDELREQGVHLQCLAASTARDVAASVRDNHEFILVTDGWAQQESPSAS